LVNDFKCNYYSIYVGIIIILVEREWSDKFIISSRRTKELSLCTFYLDEYLLRFNIHFSHALIVYTSLISRNVQAVQRYSQIKIVMRIYLLITRFIYRYINQTLKRFCFVWLFIKNWITG
jgi:hypothetical protein